MKLGTRFSILAAVAALTAAVLAGPGVARASAATATLSIPYSGCVNSYGTHFDYTMRVQGTMGNYGASRVEVRLWGDDEWSDDFLGGPFVQSYPWGGGYYFVEFCMNKSTLNEDWGQDEIYAGVRVFDGSGRQRETVESNRIRDYF
jgi:hypothetical protein